MGSFTSRFRRKKPAPVEELKEIEDRLKKIGDHRKSIEQKQKTVRTIVINGSTLYVLVVVVVFLWYLPDSRSVRFDTIVPFILLPFLIYGMKWIMSRYFNSKMVKANREYKDLQQKKKDVIHNIMETETFNKVKEILSKYAPETLNRQEMCPLPLPESQTLIEPVVARPNTERFRKRLVEPQPQAQAIAPSRSIPKPISSSSQDFSTKLLEYIVGDGSSHRYALICRHCSGHNGMALPEEFPYLAYNCCYCLKFNPACKKRSVGPPLESSVAQRLSSTRTLEPNNHDPNIEETSPNLGQTDDDASINDEEDLREKAENNHERDVEETRPNLWQTDDDASKNDEEDLREKADNNHERNVEETSPNLRQTDDDASINDEEDLREKVDNNHERNVEEISPNLGQTDDDASINGEEDLREKADNNHERNFEEISPNLGQTDDDASINNEEDLREKAEEVIKEAGDMDLNSSSASIINGSSD